MANLGLRFYVECIRGAEGSCQSTGRRKTLRCAVDANPPATSFKWLKNGIPTNGIADEIAIGAEMIGATIQCGARNGLNNDDVPQLSLPVAIDPYSAALLVADNFQQVQTTAPFLPGNRIEMKQHFSMACQVEGKPRPVVFWKLRRANGQV
ncbi:CRE-IGCM-3 protein [Aphelenchoides avenae]|nr:CRE-IGCM-3 protein [Aphelenchus avenae]